MEWETLKGELAKSSFRSRFHLTAADRHYIAEKGWQVIAAQARRIITERLAPAHPYADGSQTPMRGHIVFVAQHATGSCCRGCLAKWHHIPPGRELSEAEIDGIVSVLLGWLKDQAGDVETLPHTPDLF